MIVFLYVLSLMITLAIDGIQSLACPEFCITPCNQTSGICNRGCRTAAWGVYCERKCPSLCYDSTCSQTNGSCLSCHKGRWEKHCENHCSIFCNNLYCDDKGGCINGCKDGRYGTSCLEKCSPGCVENLCNPKDGTCASGCKEDYYGLKCEKRNNSNCQPSTCRNQSDAGSICCAGFYGELCSKICSPNCFNNFCDSKDGNCTEGCKSEWTGEKCDVKSLINTSNFNFELLIIISLGVLLVICLLIFTIRRCGRNFSFADPSSNSFSSSATQATTVSIPGADEPTSPVGSQVQTIVRSPDGLSGASQSSGYEEITRLPETVDYYSYAYANLKQYELQIDYHLASFATPVVNSSIIKAKTKAFHEHAVFCASQGFLIRNFPHEESIVMETLWPAKMTSSSLAVCIQLGMC
ncbi:platelet endothelial aggregation receptor 1-like [Saccostrea cucullata]|uniref:platelet endothelial aggregation receptor 1-like n=1 Tax=Saccostrea cuccullata TaxID=36930 RepID=UPI002ED572B2